MDKATRDSRILSNMGLVGNCVRKYARSRTEYEDLMGYGTIGLIKAIDKFDESRDIKFSTYAVPWIVHETVRALANTSRGIRLPVYLTEHLTRYVRLRQEEFARTGKNPSLQTTIKRLQVSKYIAKALENLYAPNTQKKEITHDPWELIHAKEATDTLLKKLPKKHADIIEYRYGLGSVNSAHTFKETGKHFGRSMSGIQYIEEKALKLMCFTALYNWTIRDLNNE